MRKLLVANRGEIAVRILRAAREMGIATVAVYSDADADAMHLDFADEAVGIGKPEPSASYLNGPAILAAARRTGADAVHPGYGFLSERAEFAEACEQAGIVFVGPSSKAMRLLGSKTDAKRLAVDSGVPIVPGFFEPGSDASTLFEAADQVGYPVMLKASAGGGGRGMRVVRRHEEFHHQLELAGDEALRAFGDGTMMVEKLIERPRHVEVQILADPHGNVACLFERECSIQRRHQKLVEEAPSVSSGPLWPEMREAAARLVRAAGYTGAGTVEFIVDEGAGRFYFLEVNARLQVEHPVTEAVTGVDIVAWQLRIDRGEVLDLDHTIMGGDRSALKGHSIEIRVIAEDPAMGFVPSVGKLLAWSEPRGPGIRVDTGFRKGSEVARYYDSLLAKVIVHAETRNAAIDRLRRALLDFHILGVKTNIAYMLAVLDHPGFRSGRFDTGFLEREFAEWTDASPPPPELGAIAAAASMEVEEGSQAASSWAAGDRFRNIV
ncbi:MAG TPA: biotin carboxylase N-terminal domain-containing protein [Fimbriimonas sp.]